MSKGLGGNSLFASVSGFGVGGIERLDVVVDEVGVGCSYVGSSAAFIIRMFSAIGLAAFTFFLGGVNMLEPISKAHASSMY